MINTRNIILDILLDIYENNSFIHISINKYSNKYLDINEQDNSFIIKTVHGCVENKILIDYIINKYSKIKAHKLRPIIRCILSFSIYQILFMDKIPVPAIVNEAVKLTEKRRLYGLKSYVNAILRNIAKVFKSNNTYNTIEERYNYINDIFNINNLYILYSIKEELLDEIITMYERYYNKTIDEYTLKKIILSQLQNNSVSIFIDENYISCDEALSILLNNNILVRKSELMDNVLLIDNIKDINTLNKLLDNKFIIIDSACVFSINALNIKKDSTILDICAAPGGKTILALSKLNNSGELIAFDKNKSKIDTLTNNLIKYNYNNVSVGINDAATYNNELKEQFDYVICDLPCSGLGIIRKKPDIKYNYSYDKKILLELQKNIIDNAIKYVKHNGYLLFSTCTISYDENIKNMEYIKSKGLTSTSLYVDDYSKKYLYSVDKHSIKCIKNGYIQFFNGIHQSDGFFISLYKKEIYD